MDVEFEPFSIRWQQDPYPVYRELRDRAPVHYAPESDAYVITRYADVERVFKTPEIFSSKLDPRRQMPGGGMGTLGWLRMVAWMLLRLRVSPRSVLRARFLISEDAEVHASMRRIVNRGFTPRRIAVWEERARQLAAEGIARLRSGEPFDLVHDLAVPLPVTVIAEMLGVGGERMHDFKSWSDAFISGTGSDRRKGSEALLVALAELHHYLRPIVKSRRDDPTDDLISTLVTTDSDLDDFEIFMFIFLLLLAGNETTTNLLGNAVDALLAHPEQLEKVQRDPDRIPALIEEVLRWDAPVQMLQRQTREETEMHGVRIPKRAHIVVMTGAANRDERQFSDPDRFDIERDSRGHLGFGFGAHFCLGASLARLEARAALEALVPELGGLERARPEREFLDSFVVRGLTRLELRAA